MARTLVEILEEYDQLHRDWCDASGKAEKGIAYIALRDVYPRLVMALDAVVEAKPSGELEAKLIDILNDEK